MSNGRLSNKDKTMWRCVEKFLFGHWPDSMGLIGVGLLLVCLPIIIVLPFAKAGLEFIGVIDPPNPEDMQDDWE